MPAQPEFTADTAALPGKSKPSATDRAREAEPTFAEARRQHPAVESATDNLGQCGLDLVRTRDTAGLERTVVLSVLAANLHRIWLVLQRRGAPAARASAKTGNLNRPTPSKST